MVVLPVIIATGEAEVIWREAVPDQPRAKKVQDPISTG
jgi:hypothetical protein